MNNFILIFRVHRNVEAILEVNVKGLKGPNITLRFSSSSSSCSLPRPFHFQLKQKPLPPVFCGVFNASFFASSNISGTMDISLLNVLSNGISSFLHPSFSGNMNSKPVSMYCQSAEQTLKLLKPIIDTTVHSDISADEELRKLFEELGQSVDELRELFENWHPLSSKFYFVMQAEPLIARVQSIGFNILQKLKASQQCLPDDLGYDMTSIIKEAINEQLEGEESPSGNITIASYFNSRRFL